MNTSTSAFSSIAEVLGDRETRETDAQTRTRRLVHLTVDQRARVRECPTSLHLEIEIVAFARALAHAAEHRLTAVSLRDVVDQLHDDDGLADAGAAEETDLTTLHERRDQVDDLDARLEDLGLRLEVRRSRDACGGSASAARPSGIGAPLSTGSPSTLRMRPSAGAPTGTVIGPPVSTTSMPRTTASVDDMATARTWLRPMCCCTSTTTWIVVSRPAPLP